jgi:hypothetical protein
VVFFWGVPLEDESMELEDGDVVAMAVKVSGVSAATLSARSYMSSLHLDYQEPPLLWWSFPED